ncbi:MAG: hypothetical protein ACKPKO_48925, partial [Candidatus Fonsibacter sp.]
YNGNITAPWGNINGQSISSTSTTMATGHITTTEGNISSTSGNIQTLQGTVGGKTNAKIQSVACTENSGTSIYTPTTKGVYLQTETVSSIGNSWIELCGSLLGNSNVITYIGLRNCEF